MPEGSVALDPAGTAPGLVVEGPGGVVVVVLPGPPRELQAMWPAAVAAPAVSRLLEDAEDYAEASMKMFGIPESTLAKSLREIGEGVNLDRLEVTTCLRRGAELEVDVRYRAPDEALRAALFDGLRKRHGPYIYTERGGEHRRAGRRAAGRPAGSAWASPARAAGWPRGSPTGRAPPPTSPVE